MKTLLKCLIFIWLGVVYINSSAQSLDADLDALMKKYKAVGLATVAIKDNNIIYNKSFGYKNLESKTPLTETDIFRIASISKSFSATAIMQLVAKKKISLNDDVSKLIGFTVRNPKYPEIVITCKMLLSHRSSLNDSNGYFMLDSINPTKVANASKCYNDYPPGTKYQYCNLNFNIIGTIIERVSGQRFDQYIKKNILDPLHLYGGYCVDSLDSNRFTTLYEYDTNKEQFVAAPDAYAPRREQIINYQMGHSTPIFSPTGGMKISAVDLAKYMMMHMNYGKSNNVRIIEKKFSQLMQKALSKEDGYGLSLMNYDDLIPDVHLTGHTGSAYGLYSAMFFDPKKKYGFVVITNGCVYSETGGVVDLLKGSINVLYNNLIPDK